MCTHSSVCTVCTHSSRLYTQLSLYSMYTHSSVYTVCTRTLLSVDLSEPIVAHLVHKAIEEDGGALTIHSEFSLGGKVVCLLDMTTCVSTATDTNHPQKLIDICKNRAHVKPSLQYDTTLHGTESSIHVLFKIVLFKRYHKEGHLYNKPTKNYPQIEIFCDFTLIRRN